MPDFYDTQDFMMVDEADDFILDDLAQFTVDEAEADTPEILMVEEEVVPEVSSESEPMSIPGSDAIWVEEEEEEEVVADKNWADDGAHDQFVSYLKDRLTKIPRHSGETVPGCERAKAFLKSLDSEISKAMRSDLEGVVDESEIDGLRKKIEDMIDRLDKQVKKLSGSKRASLDVRLVSDGHCDVCEASAPIWHDTANDKLVCMSCDGETKQTDDMEKIAGTPIINVYVSAWERAIVGTMINSKVSAGRNIEETYDRLKNKYNFTPREELAIQQLISDYGYPVYKDRGLLNEPSDPMAGDGVDWQTNYQV
ncbi:hypothetical protein LCGC14_0742900 [marine sediment metagenome]|uniref:Uncharacterized protein n=1 Tax=marine sediment metagenome TaxID=412755 RepID=A0A0F9Q665_9ZZZZ